MSNLPWRASAVLLFLATAHCSSSGSSGPAPSQEGGASDATTDDASGDASVDAFADASSDVSVQPPVEASADASVDAPGTIDAPLDPVPAACDAGGIPPVVGGTPACPDDKNLAGCPCTTVDAGAACWPGLRSNRGRGDCTDGTTTCVQQGGQLAWGSCQGDVLPVSGATDPKTACACFSTGHWAIANLSPCFATDSTGTTVQGVASSAVLGGTTICPMDFTQTPTAAWSTDTLDVDCSGEYSLCYTLKAGDPAHPQASDCTVVQVCTAPQHYAPAGTVATFPPLPGWLAPASALACAQQFYTTGGYGQMSVQGQSDLCEPVGRVFQSVTYCAESCSGPNPPAQCAGCTPGGGGAF